MSVYTFGDNDLAAARLALLAHVFEPSARDLLRRWAPRDVVQAVDLGCGPGHSTALVHEVSGAARTSGIERSPAYLAAARRLAVPGLGFVEHDVTVAPLPVPVADLVYARFLLTHLPNPVSALDVWSGTLAVGGRLLLQETASLTSREPALGRYYELVAELQNAHGQALDVGSRLAALADGLARTSGGTLAVVHSAIRLLRPPVTAMARLHALNLRTWRADPVAATRFEIDELDGLDEALTSIADGAASEPIELSLAEVVLERAA